MQTKEFKEFLKDFNTIKDATVNDFKIENKIEENKNKNDFKIIDNNQENKTK